MVEISIVTIPIILMIYVPLEQLDSITDLGVNFDSQLKFDKHIDDKINEAYAFL